MRHSFAFTLSALCLAFVSPVRAQTVTYEYTDLTNCPRDTSMDADAEEHGSDAPNICPGPGGEYEITEYFSVFDVHRRVSLKDERANFSVTLRPSKNECPVARYGNKVEWRMKGGKPFAVIQRVTCYALNENGGGPGKQLAEYLVVKGLKGFESIDGAVSTKSKDANEKARAIADEGLRGR
ncbi:hypothetical protein [Vitiosangium sp. GDMCC 1.1324]|uniref:hypothetical protein n=1 Tax=Vitiosangium sp. (strain GDMCC 1.1324) TaxID=2138576 RepID=UPI000D3DADEE|nr:hypothetical protein [Vitiosangium sp. GDMCC 1.1324]PTL83462.1 hypothetical protein DAT35_15955 [Vitiosangium sp. GDMCC 1.1324]